MKFFLNKLEGRTPIITLVIAGSFTLLASIGGAWVTANGAVNEKVADVNTEVKVIQERENNHYLEVQKQITTLNEKIDGQSIDIKQILNVLSKIGVK